MLHAAAHLSNTQLFLSGIETTKFSELATSVWSANQYLLDPVDPVVRWSSTGRMRVSARLYELFSKVPRSAAACGGPVWRGWGSAWWPL